MKKFFEFAVGYDKVGPTESPNRLLDDDNPWTVNYLNPVSQLPVTTGDKKRIKRSL